MTYFFTLIVIKISAVFHFFCRISAYCFVGVGPTQCGKQKGCIQPLGTQNKKRILSVKHMLLEGIMHQFRIGFHLHLFQNAGPVGADRFHT